MRLLLKNILTAEVIVLAHKVGCLKELIHIHEGTDADEAAENVPKPEVSSAEVVGYTAASNLHSDSVGDVVIPNYACNTAGDRSDKEEQQAEVHCVLVVVL